MPLPLGLSSIARGRRPKPTPPGNLLPISQFDQPFATTRLEFAFRELAVLIGIGLLEVGDEGLGVCCRKRVAGRHRFIPDLRTLLWFQNSLGPTGFHRRSTGEHAGSG